MTRGIRYRVLSILLLGVLTSALSVMALVQLLSTSQAQRIERAREAVAEEVERLARSPAAIVEPPTFGTVGMRAGRLAGDPPAGLPEGWAGPLRAAADESRQSGARVVRDATLGGGTLVLGATPAGSGGAEARGSAGPAGAEARARAAPAANADARDVAGPGAAPGRDGAPGAVAWAAVLVRPIPWLRAWQWIVSLLTAATALLVATTLYTVVTMTRGATELREALRALARDLGAKVPRPPLRELADIADGVARLAEDLAAAREAEARLGARLAANERLTALGRVAAGVAHEVRNPLASIKLRLDLAAASGARLPEVAERAIAHASSEIARLDRLVADLLIVAGRAPGGRGDTDVGALVRARAEALAPWAEGRGVSVRASGAGRAAADADALARAVDNLLRNAVEASPPGAAVEVAVAAERGRLVVRVDDEGPGVPEAQRPALFEPFFTTKPGGTGLGLALSRAIARAHGGDLTYARPGGVSRFELSLAPAAPPTARGEAA